MIFLESYHIHLNEECFFVRNHLERSIKDGLCWLIKGGIYKIWITYKRDNFQISNNVSQLL